MQVLKLTNQNQQEVVAKTVEVLRNGGLVVAPSDTVYGLLVDAKNEDAVKKLIAFKNRPIGKSISVFMADLAMAKEYVEANESQQKVLQQLLPGCFTIVLPSKQKTSRLLESEKRTLGIRVISYEFIHQLIKAFGSPTTATSANLSGKPPHHNVQKLLAQLPESKKELVDLVIDAGQLPRNKPSTVLDITQSEVKVLRQGDVVWNNCLREKTDSEEQTQKFAHTLLDTLISTLQFERKKSLVIIFKGELGAGKTAFIKAIAQKLSIKDTIISPTYTIYYEYGIENDEYFEKLYHFDLYNIQDVDEFNHLGIEDIIKKRSLVCIEWGDKSGDIIGMLKKWSHVVFVEIKYVGETKREIEVQY